MTTQSRRRSSPPARMVELLTAEKHELLRTQGHITPEDFEEAWARSWAQMVTERAWPHATPHRKAWRKAMEETKPETRAAFLDAPSGFSRYLASLAQQLDVAAPEDDGVEHVRLVA